MPTLYEFVWNQEQMKTSQKNDEKLPVGSEETEKLVFPGMRLLQKLRNHRDM
jgi:hypothetical protein